MVGDAFHVLKSLFWTSRIPPKWETDPYLSAEAKNIGREFCSREVLSLSRSVFRQRGREFPNFNFPDNVPDLVRKADQACIAGYGLEGMAVELIEQLQKVRRFETWDL